MTNSPSEAERQKTAPAWECFRDAAYYDLWAVRPVGDKSFASQNLFHVQSQAEAEVLRDLLNERGNLESFVAAVHARDPAIVASIRAECFDDSDWATAIDAALAEATRAKAEASVDAPGFDACVEAEMREGRP